VRGKSTAALERASMLSRGSQRGLAAATLALAALALPTRVPAQAVLTRVVSSGPVRLDDAFVTATYACVSFTDLDARTATSLDITVRFTRPNGAVQQYGYTRVGTFSSGVPILGPTRGDTHTSPSKLANCAALDAPDDALAIDIAVTSVRFEDGSRWTAPAPSPPPVSGSAPTPAATEQPATVTAPGKPRPF
jgi:hypothetical protein